VNKKFLNDNEYYSKRFSPELYINDSSAIVRYFEVKRIRKIVNLINPEKHNHILDVGCGAGDILMEIEKQKQFNLKLFGVDASNYMVERSRKRVLSGTVIENAVSEKIPYDNSSFDKIICSEVLEHVEDLGKSLSEISRVLKVGGSFVFSYPNENLINILKKGVNILRINKIIFSGAYQPEMDMTDHWHKRKIELKMLLKELSKVKLCIKKVVPLPFSFPLKYIVYGNK
jgi:ubiquinone/menaquinone biosynthesis C-methylase UbiE